MTIDDILQPAHVPTKAEVLAAFDACVALADAIRDLKQVPEGHLYAVVCGHLNLRAFDAAIGALVKARLITKENHLLTWVA